MAVGNNFKLKETIIKISLLAACLLNQKCSHPFPAFSFTMQANKGTGITFSSISEISSCKRNPENPGLVSKKEKFIWDPQSVIYKGRTGCSFVCQTTEESILFSVASIRLFPYNQYSGWNNFLEWSPIRSRWLRNARYFETDFKSHRGRSALLPLIALDTLPLLHLHSSKKLYFY